MTRVEVTFRNLQTSDWLEREIRERAHKLETHFPYITACRALVAMPHRRHGRGNAFAVHLEVVVPGEEIAVSHSPHARDTGSKDEVSPALSVVCDAFASAKRQLQDYAQRRRHDVKAHTARGA